MPYTIKSNHPSCKSGQFAVVKKSDGKLIGCHDTKEEAVNQIGAIESNEKDREDKAKKQIEKSYSYVPLSVTTFEELDAIQEVMETRDEVFGTAWVFPLLVENVLYSGGDPKSGLARLLESTKTKLLSLFDDDVNKEKEQTPFFIYKDSVTGTYFWIARYSNNIVDEDIPPDLISSKSHKEFVEKVDNGEFDYPELWLWHEPDWRIGKATWVAYDEENGFALAAGYFYKWAEDIAIALSEVDDWGLSHGMPLSSISRDLDNPKVIVSHKTVEISPLPLWVAANKYTGFAILTKEDDMAIEKNKREDAMKILGIGAEVLDKIEESNKDLSLTADEKGLERKDTTAETEEEEQAVLLNEPDEEVEEEADEDTAVDPDLLPVEEVVEEEDDGLPEFLTPFTDDQVKELADAFEAFEAKFVTVVKEVINEALLEIRKQKEETEKEFEEKVKETPALSLKHILFGNPKNGSATNAEETTVDGRASLAKSKPATHEKREPDVFLTGDPIKNTLVDSVINFKEVMGLSNGKEEEK